MSEAESHAAARRWARPDAALRRRSARAHRPAHRSSPARRRPSNSTIASSPTRKPSRKQHFERGYQEGRESVTPLSHPCTQLARPTGPHRPAPPVPGGPGRSHQEIHIMSEAKKTVEGRGRSHRRQGHHEDGTASSTSARSARRASQAHGRASSASWGTSARRRPLAPAAGQGLQRRSGPADHEPRASSPDEQDPVIAQILASIRRPDPRRRRA